MKLLQYFWNNLFNFHCCMMKTSAIWRSSKAVLLYTCTLFSGYAWQCCSWDDPKLSDRKVGKQCRPRSDCSGRSLIWVFTVCHGILSPSFGNITLRFYHSRIFGCPKCFFYGNQNRDHESKNSIKKLSHLMTKPTKWSVRPAKTQISLGICPVWSESSLSAWRNIGSLTTYWVHSEDSDQSRQMPRLIWVFAGRIDHFVDFVMRRLI